MHIFHIITLIFILYFHIFHILVSAKPFSLFKKIKGRFPCLDSDLFRYFVLAKELYNDEQKYTFYRTADVRPTTFFT